MQPIRYIYARKNVSQVISRNIIFLYADPLQISLLKINFSQLLTGWLYWFLSMYPHINQYFFFFNTNSSYWKKYVYPHMRYRYIIVLLDKINANLARSWMSVERIHDSW